MAKRKCKVTSCRQYVDIPNNYCDKHKGQDNRQYNKYVRTSPENKKYDDFYHTSQWRRTRQHKLSMQPMCEVCLAHGKRTIATIVHHKEEIRTELGWKKRLDYDNLESICLDCHNKEEHPNSFRHRSR